jgi:lipoic acid synthetase
MTQVLIPSIKSRAEIERDLRRGSPMRDAPGVDAPRPQRRPEWLKVRIREGSNFVELRDIMRSRGLHTVCEEANCPNIYECWEAREATFLLCGDLCTRRCGFCDVMTAKPRELDPLEPTKIAEAVSLMGLEFAVITGVARDDLDDGASGHWAAAIEAVRAAVPECGIEVLIPDFKGRKEHPRASLRRVLDARPHVLAHNLETVRRLHPRIRPGFGYDSSLELLKWAKEFRRDQVTKSNLIVGMGESTDEVFAAMADLRTVGCDVLTIGQYLQPSVAWHLPVDRWVHPDEFHGYKEFGEEELGFAWVESGPLVRSSFRAGRQYASASARLALGGGGTPSDHSPARPARAG